jgi:hypothetical protein
MEQGTSGAGKYGSRELWEWETGSRELGNREQGKRELGNKKVGNYIYSQPPSIWNYVAFKHPQYFLNKHLVGNYGVEN